MLFDMRGDCSLDITFPADSYPAIAPDIPAATQALKLLNYYSYLDYDLIDNQAPLNSIRIVGLGIIGCGIAAHLRRKCFPVFVWNRSPRPVPNFVGSLGELAGLCNYIQIFVSDDDALLQTVEQLSEKLTPRHVVLAHSTVGP